MKILNIHDQIFFKKYDFFLLEFRKILPILVAKAKAFEMTITHMITTSIYLHHLLFVLAIKHINTRMMQSEAKTPIMSMEK